MWCPSLLSYIHSKYSIICSIHSLFYNCKKLSITFFLVAENTSITLLSRSGLNIDKRNNTLLILTHLAHIKSLYCATLHCRISVVLLCAISISFVMSSIISHQAPIDDVMSFQLITNVMIVCKYPHYSQIFGGKSAMQWWKAESYRQFQRPLLCLLCVRNQTDPLS